ncbi:MAG: hypothetical protein DMG30_18330 [Acidobacteria bacterium]|nr:MAG: hypothetical protein DMG30_18330 [Acidobacteriota bacterium]
MSEKVTYASSNKWKPIAGNRHDGFEVAGTGNQLTVWLLRHSEAADKTANLERWKSFLCQLPVSDG